MPVWLAILWQDVRSIPQTLDWSDWDFIVGVCTVIVVLSIRLRGIDRRCAITGATYAVMVAGVSATVLVAIPAVTNARFLGNAGVALPAFVAILAYIRWSKAPSVITTSEVKPGKAKK